MTAAAIMRFLTSKQPVTVRAMLLVGCTGLVTGLILGCTMMGSMHALFETSVEHHRHHKHAIHAPTKADVDVQGQTIPSTSTSTAVPALNADNLVEKGQTVHTLCTSNGSPYINFQSRIMYGTYQLTQKMPGGENMVAFTRILHRTQPDELMKEIPTHHVQPLHPRCDTWCEFPVADRPNAVKQFLAAAAEDRSLVKAPWILLIETDYVWMSPLQQIPMAESRDSGLAFPYGYIQPAYPGISDVMRALYPDTMGPLQRIPATGPAPVLMRFSEWLRVTPEWEDLTARIEGDANAKAKLGWVREMYAFSIACAKKRVDLQLKLPPRSPLMVQPPADHSIGAAALLHYTWGSIFKDTRAGGAEVWKFDKRFFTDKAVALKVPQLEEPPGWREGLALQDNVTVTVDLIATLRVMIRRMNDATRDLPELQPVPA
eukprot:jgi/Ulvmu1/11798/UM080_0009.1